MIILRIILGAMVIWGFWSIHEGIARAESIIPGCLFHPGIWLFLFLATFKSNERKLKRFRKAAIVAVPILLVCVFIIFSLTKVRRPSDGIIKAACTLCTPNHQRIKAAAMYKPGKTNSLVLLSRSGPHEWTADIPAKWKPESLSDLCLVACVSNLGGRPTGYQNVTYETRGFSRKELYRDDVKIDYVVIEVVEARTGFIIGKFESPVGTFRYWSEIERELNRFVSGQVTRCKIADLIRSHPEVAWNPDANRSSGSLAIPFVEDRELALLYLTDKELLADISKNSEDPCLREIAVRNAFFSNMELLADIAKNDDNANVREAAGQSREDHINIVKDIALKHPDPSIRLAAIAELKEQDTLIEVALKDQNQNVRIHAAKKLTDQSSAQSIFSDIAKNSRDFKARLEAAENLVNKNFAQSVFIEIAFTPAEKGAQNLCRLRAIQQITDPTILARFIEDKSIPLRLRQEAEKRRDHLMKL